MASRRSNIHRGEESVEINISPMIDMVFILLIFFIVTTVFVEESGVDANRPEPATEQQEDDNKIIKILITETGKIEIEGSERGLGGVRSYVKGNLEDKETPVIVEVEPKARAGLMVRVMDEAAIAGAEKITIQDAPQ